MLSEYNQLKRDIDIPELTAAVLALPPDRNLRVLRELLPYASDPYLQLKASRVLLTSSRALNISLRVSYRILLLVL